MICHIVLYKPRPDLDPSDERAFADALTRALQRVEGVRRCRIGRRVRVGAGYEDLMPQDFTHCAVIEFDDEAGLKAYLEHPAHDEVGERFWAAAETVLVYDYRMQEGDRAADLVAPA